MKRLTRIVFLLFLSFGLIASVSAASSLAEDHDGSPQFSLPAFAHMHLEMYKHYVVKTFPTNFVSVWQVYREDMVPLYQWNGADNMEWN